MNKLAILLVALFLTAFGTHAFAADPAPGDAPAEGTRLYLKLEPITATIFRAQQPAGTFTAAVTLEIPDEGTRTEIIEMRRQLRDAMFRELHAMFEREEHTNRKVGVDAVKRRMLVVSRRVVGKEKVINVFVNTLVRNGA